MKHNSLYTLALILMAGVGLVACSGNKDEAKSGSGKQGMDMASGNHAAHASMDMGSSEPTDASIYNVQSVWQNRHGQRVKLGSLAGKVQVVAMVYTHCEFACPRILADMKRIQSSLSEPVRQTTHFVIISIDPQRDTPKRLFQFADENKLSEDQWTLLHGDAGDILEVAAMLGVKYKRISKTDFTHSNMVTILNKQGEVAYQQKKLTNDPVIAVNTIEQLSSD